MTNAQFSEFKQVSGSAIWRWARPVVLAAAILVATGSCGAEVPPVDLDAERAALRAADSLYTRLATAKDAEGVSELYTTDATIYPPAGPTVRGIDGVREFAAEFTAIPGLAMSFRPLVIEVSRDGDMGYTINAVEITVFDEAGNPVTELTRDFHLWRKQDDGNWKVAVDIWNAEPASAATSNR